ncbi:MAG: hypothetical protein WCL14_13175 [Bacteroidota bacterium]
MITIKALFLVLATVVNKALLPLFTTRGLSAAQQYAKAKTVTNNLVTNVSVFGVMSPTTTTMLSDIATGQLYISDIASLRLQILAKEQLLKENLKMVNNNMTYQYCPAVKKTANGVKSVVDLSGLICKGFGPAKTMVRFNNSFPEPIKADQNIGLRVIQSLIPSDVLSKGKPYGAKSIMCYRQVGGAAPLTNNHPLATRMVPFSKMKMIDTNFTSADIGKTVYYIFCWVDKDGNLGPESAVYDYTITA